MLHVHILVCVVAVSRRDSLPISSLQQNYITGAALRLLGVFDIRSVRRSQFRLVSRNLGEANLSRAGIFSVSWLRCLLVFLVLLSQGPIFMRVSVSCVAYKHRRTLVHDAINRHRLRSD